MVAANSSQGDSNLSTSDFRRRAAPVAADLETLAAVVAAGPTARAAPVAADLETFAAVVAAGPTARAVVTAARPAPCATWSTGSRSDADCFSCQRNSRRMVLAEPASTGRA